MSVIFHSRYGGPAGPQGPQGPAGPGVINWKGTWSAATAYVVNDAVTLNGTSYICILNHTNQSPPNGTYWGVLAQKGDTGPQGLQGNQGVAGPTGATGATGPQGPQGDSFTWRGAWSSGASYAARDVVSRAGSSYICIQAHSNQEPPNAAFWELMAQKGDTGATGAQGIQGPAGNNGSDGADGLSVTWRGAWNSATAYAVNDAVELNGSSYICVQAHTNQTPPNGTYWNLMAQKGNTGREPGIRFTFNSDTTASDPGSGKFKFNFEIPASQTSLYISETDADGNDVAEWLKSWDDSTNSVRGRLFVMRENTPATLHVYNITGALTDNGSWNTFPVGNIVANGSISDGDSVRVWFQQTGAKGDTGATGATGQDSPAQAGGRLTAQSGVPVPTTNLVDQATLYYTPYIHNRISLYNGSAWAAIAFSEVSIAVPTGTDTNHDVFGYNNAGSLALETVAWTNDSTRATALTRQDGILVKSGDATRRYLGTIRTAVVSGRVQDTESRRFIFNMYNRMPRTLRKQDSTVSWTYNNSAWRQANGSSANQVEIVIGDAGPTVDLEVVSAAFMDAAGNQGYVAIGKNTVGNSGLAGVVKGTNTEEMFGKLADTPAVGYHSYKWVERAGAGTLNIDNTSNELCGLMGKAEFM